MDPGAKSKRRDEFARAILPTDRGNDLTRFRLAIERLDDQRSFEAGKNRLQDNVGCRNAQFSRFEVRPTSRHGAFEQVRRMLHRKLSLFGRPTLPRDD